MRVLPKIDQFGIELVLADNLAETVPNLGTTAVPVTVRALWRKLLAGSRNGTDFLDRAQTDAVGLAQGPIDGSRLGHAHLGPANQVRDIGRIGVAVTHKTSTGFGLVDRGLEPRPYSRCVGRPAFIDSNDRVVSVKAIIRQPPHSFRLADFSGIGGKVYEYQSARYTF